MTDEQAIANLIYAVAECRDRGDWLGAAELFADATFETHYPAGYPGVGVPADEVADRQPGGHGVQRGIAETAELFRTTSRVYEDELPHTQYVTTNLIIEVDAPNDRATARSYYVVYQSRPDFALQAICAGRYHDGFQRVDGTWRFTSRAIYADHSGDLSHHLAMDPLAYGAEFDRRRS
ncbi:MAG: hypothetical protein JWN46_3152 [Acidimicrobiales bacterium]|nr:hypothetical protein [Acidimicrobiales bacterium]